MSQVTLLSVDLAVSPDIKGGGVGSEHSSTEQEQDFSQVLERQISTETNGNKSAETAAEKAQTAESHATPQEKNTTSNNKIDTEKSNKTQENSESATDHQSNTAENTAGESSTNGTEKSAANQVKSSDAVNDNLAKQADSKQQDSSIAFLSLLNQSGKMLNESDKSTGEHLSNDEITNAKTDVSSAVQRALHGDNVSQDADAEAIDKNTIIETSKLSKAEQEAALQKNAANEALNAQEKSAQALTESEKSAIDAKAAAHVNGSQNVSNKIASSLEQTSDKSSAEKEVKSSVNSLSAQHAAEKGKLTADVAQIDKGDEVLKATIQSADLVADGELTHSDKNSADKNSSDKNSDKALSEQSKAAAIKSQAALTQDELAKDTSKQSQQLSSSNELAANESAKAKLAAEQANAESSAKAADELTLETDKPKKTTTEKTQPHHDKNMTATQAMQAAAMDAKNSVEPTESHKKDEQLNAQIISSANVATADSGAKKSINVTHRDAMVENKAVLENTAYGSNTEQEENLAKDNNELMNKEHSQNQSSANASQAQRSFSDLYRQSVAASEQREQLQSEQRAAEVSSMKNTVDNTLQQKVNQSQATEVMNINRKDFVDSLKNKVMMMVNQKLQQVDIKLDPPELGNVQVRVNLQGDAAVVNFVVQNQQAKDAFEQQMGRLRDMLQESGVDVGEANVRQQQKNDQEQGAFGESNNGQGLADNNGAVAVDEQVIAQTLVKASAGGVDFYA